MGSSYFGGAGLPTWSLCCRVGACWGVKACGPTPTISRDAAVPRPRPPHHPPSPPPPIGSVPRAMCHVGSGAAQHPGATVEGNNLESKMSCFGNQFFGEPPRPPCPPKTMLRWRRENVFARRETIWRVPTGDLLFPANIVFGGQGGRAPFQRRRKRTRVKGVFIFILQIVSFLCQGWGSRCFCRRSAKEK